MKLRGYLFILSLFAMTLSATALVSDQILACDSFFAGFIFVSGFGFLFLNVAYLFAIGTLYCITKPKLLPEGSLGHFPPTAMCYFIRNEDHGLFERMKYSFEGNQHAGVDFWILSDSDSEYEAEELSLRQSLEEAIGGRVFYRRREAPVERKQGNLHDFVSTHPEYVFLYIADADSMIPPNTVSRLIEKALHPSNQDIAIFQTFIKTAHAKSYYAKFEGIASETSQRLYFATLQAFFGRTISFGHQHLARRECLEKIVLPKGILSHDNWDTALLDQAGYRVAFVTDVITYDEAPAHYIEARKREARWSHGTLQGSPLIYKKGLSPIVRFLSFYGIYCYLTQPIFLLWLIGGFIAQSFFAGELICFKVDSAWLGMPVNQGLTIVLAFSLAVNFFHKAVVIKSTRDAKHFLYELLMSTFLNAGNFLYASIDMLLFPIKKLIWKPMRKNPFDTVSWLEVSRHLFGGTLAGLFGIWYLAEGTPYPHLASLPIFLSLAFSIPMVYGSAQIMKEKEHQYA